MIDAQIRWSTTDTSELYEFARWGKGFFSVSLNDHLLVRPDQTPGRPIDLKQLVDRVPVHALRLQILVRFNDILKNHPVTEFAGLLMSWRKLQKNWRGSIGRCRIPIL